MIEQGWHPCTEQRVQHYFGQVLTQSRDQAIREALVELFLVLHRRGTARQRGLLLSILSQAVIKLSRMGSPCKTFLDLIFKYTNEAEDAADQVLDMLAKQVVNSVSLFLDHPHLSFFSFIEDHLVSQHKEPFLQQAFQLNCCTRCYQGSIGDARKGQRLKLQQRRQCMRQTHNKVTYRLGRVHSVQRIKICNKTKFNMKAVTLKYLEGQSLVAVGSQPLDANFEQTFATRQIVLEFALERMRLQTTCLSCKAQYEGIVCTHCGKGLEVHIFTADNPSPDLAQTMKDVKSLYLQLRNYRDDAQAFFNVFVRKIGQITPGMAIPIPSVIAIHQDLMAMMALAGAPSQKIGQIEEAVCFCCLKMFVAGFLERLGDQLRKLPVGFTEQVLKGIEGLVWSQKVSSRMRHKAMECYMKVAGQLWDSPQILVTRMSEKYAKKQGQQDQVLMSILERAGVKVGSKVEPFVFRARQRQVDFRKKVGLFWQPAPRFGLDQFTGLGDWIIQHRQDKAKLIQFLQWALPLKRYWNCWVYDAVTQLQKCMSEWPPLDLLKMVILGCRLGLQQFFLKKCLQVVTPRRKVITLRLQPPERQLKDYQRRNKEKLQHPLLQVKEIVSSEIGYRMRDLHDFICKQTNCTLFDLLVENKLIDDLEVPIQAVFKKFGKERRLNSGFANICKQLFNGKQSLLHLRDIGADPREDSLKVVFRLRGLFGQASEEMVGSLPDEQEDECLKLASYFATSQGGRPVVQELVAVLERQCPQVSPDISLLLLRVFNRLMKEGEVKQCVAHEQSNIDKLINLVLKLVELGYYSEAEAFCPVLTSLIHEVTAKGIRRKMSQPSDLLIEEQEDSSSGLVLRITEIIAKLQTKGLKGLATSLQTLMPYCSKDEQTATALLIEYLGLGASINIEFSLILPLVETLANIPEHYSRLKLHCLESGLVSLVFEELNNGGLKADCPRTMLLLRFINQAARGCFQVQTLVLQSGILQHIFQLSLGQRQLEPVRIAHVLLEYLQTGQLVEQAVRAHCSSLLTKHKAKIAQISRQKRQLARKKFSKSSHSVLKEEGAGVTQQPLQCMVCKSGYQSTPAVLGVYVQTNAAEQLFEQEGKPGPVVSLSWFNLIHLSCHQGALSSQPAGSQHDGRLSVMGRKNEWAWATKANGENECNNWLPIKHPLCNKQEYELGLKKYKDAADSVATSKFVSSPILLMHSDLQNLLRTLASPDAKRGTKSSFENNIRLALVMANNLRNSEPGAMPKPQPNDPASLLFMPKQTLITSKPAILKYCREGRQARCLSVYLSLLLRRLPGLTLDEQLSSLGPLQQEWRGAVRQNQGQLVELVGKQLR